MPFGCLCPLGACALWVLVRRRLYAKPQENAIGIHRRHLSFCQNLFHQKFQKSCRKMASPLWISLSLLKNPSLVLHNSYTGLRIYQPVLAASLAVLITYDAYPHGNLCLFGACTRRVFVRGTSAVISSRFRCPTLPKIHSV
jgi:hypothetical protein